MTASILDPTTAGARAAPSSASPGQVKAASATPWSVVDSGQPGDVSVASKTSGHSKTAASNAPWRLARIAARRRPVGSGRQFGDQGFAGPMEAEYPAVRTNRWRDAPLGWVS